MSEDKELYLHLMEDEETQEIFPQEEQSQEEDQEETPDANELKARLAELEAKNKQLYARLKKEKTATKQPKTQSASENIDDDLRSKVETLSLAEQKRQFGYAHGLSPEETDAVFRYNPNPTAETLSDPFMKGGLSMIRKSKRLSDGIPTSSSRSFSVEGKSFQELPKEDKQKHYQSLIKSRVVKK